MDNRFILESFNFVEFQSECANISLNVWHIKNEFRDDVGDLKAEIVKIMSHVEA